MRIEHFISNRYLLAKKQAGTSLITKVAILGLILAVCILITVLSVMNGFHKELRMRVLDSISHGYITSINTFEDAALAKQTIDAHPNVLRSNSFIERYGLISFGGNAEGILIRGINPDEQLTTHILDDLELTTALSADSIIIGKGLATSLFASVGDKITILTPKLNTSIFGTTPQIKRFTISAIFEGGVSEYDNNLAFINMTDAKALFKTSEIDGIRLQLTDMMQAEQVLRELSVQLGGNYYGVSWQTQKHNFFTALQLEKRMIAIVLSLIVAIAVFNVVSMMIMLIKDKKYDIAILRTFGFNKRQIQKTMFYLGVKIGIFAIMIGMILGLILSYFIADVMDAIETLFQTKFFPEDVFYISSFPSEIMLGDVLLVMSVSFVLVILSSIYPALVSSKANISTTLKEL